MIMVVRRCGDETKPYTGGTMKIAIVCNYLQKEINLGGEIYKPKLCTSRRGEVLKPLVALRKVILNPSKGDF
jgi:hypothetical protein